jgi:D-glycero-D-manno-heptose 1,7-bisphosphate phosphatase
MKSPGTAFRRAAFLDRDGVINIDRGYVVRREDFQFVPGVLDAARRLRDMGFLLVVASNQSGIGRGLYSEAEFNALAMWMREEFLAAGAPLAGVYFCPHHPTEALGEYRRSCECRKPAPGMLLAAARDLGIDLQSSAMFGDKDSDLEAARDAGVPIRMLLGTDAREVPNLPSDTGLATAAFRGLLDAVADSRLLAPASTAGSMVG